MTTQATHLRHVATFCGECSCGCPELYVDESAPADRRIVLTDDFGQRVEMSVEQLGVIVDMARSGALDAVAAAT